jgi:hypothetical protein
MKALFIAVLATVVGGLIVWYLTGSASPFHHNTTPVAQGSITAVSVNSRSPCCTFEVKAVIQGYDGQACPLFATIVSYSTNAGSAPREVATYTPQADNDEGAFNGYVAVEVPVSGSYYVRFTLDAPNGTELDQRDSGVLNVTVG